MSYTTFYFILAMVANIAVWIMFFNLRRAIKISKRACDAADDAIRKWMDAKHQNEELIEEKKNINASYDIFVEQYRVLIKKHDALLQKYIEKTGEEYEE